MTAFGQETLADRIERAYHQILAEPSACYASLRALNVAIRATPTDGLVLAQALALAEYPTHQGWPVLTRVWALLIRVEHLQHYRTIEESLADCREDDPDAAATALNYQAKALEDALRRLKPRPYALRGDTSRHAAPIARY